MKTPLNRIPLFLALAAAIALVACKGETSSVDERFVDAFVEMRIVDQMYGAEAPMARLARRTVLEKYGYTRESFLEASAKIQEDDTRWVPFQARVVDRVDSILDPESYVKRKEEEAARAAAKKAKPAKKEAKQ